MLEEADSKPLADGLSIPEEIKIREARLAKLREAKETIEKSYEAVREHDPFRLLAPKKAKEISPRPRQTHERKVIYFFIRPGRG
ncbi:hypothetical protein AGMMS49940_02440 [Spirochaetia bacterium]|nr:hypothetical protein AGMMS49940_02440 [Spirochaetia bacterium]